jgi:hypothetical protein
MSIEFGLGRFGDRRLQKGGLPYMPPSLSDPALASGALPGGEHERCGSRASSAMTP